MADGFQSDAFQADAFQNGGGAVTPPATITPSYGTGANELPGNYDLSIDPITRDFVDTTDGQWVETTDSRTAVLFQMECEKNAWWGDPTAGSRIKAIIRGDDSESVISTQALIDEVRACLQVLVDEGIITNLVVSLGDKTTDGRVAILLLYTDRGSGQPVDLAYVPFAA